MENEVKVLEVDVEDLIDQFEEMGAIKKYEGYIDDTYFDFGESQMEENKRLFRLRENASCTLYTIKKKEKNGKMKVCHEVECKVTNPEGFKKVMEKYGLTPTRHKRKFRISYSIDGVEFDIDKYENIPAFMEIEAETREIMDERIEKLGLQDNQVVTFGSRSLFKYYNIPYDNLK